MARRIEAAKLEEGHVIRDEDGTCTLVAVAKPFEGAIGVWTYEVSPDKEPVLMFPPKQMVEVLL